MASDDSGRGSAGRTQRYQLLRDLAADPDRHLILVTATPHCGNDTAFRNLIGLLDPDLRDVDLASDAGRALLADHMVQRRRADIRSYLGADTQFPADRQDRRGRLHPVPRVPGAVRRRARLRPRPGAGPTGTKLQQRIRWWSAPCRCCAPWRPPPPPPRPRCPPGRPASRPHSSDAADALGAAEILDQVEDDSLDSADATPGALVEDDDLGPRRGPAAAPPADRRATGRRPPTADAQARPADQPGQGPAADGYHPIVFCRFIPTAHYVADHLRTALRNVAVEVVTGELPSEERAARVAHSPTPPSAGPRCSSPPTACPRASTCRTPSRPSSTTTWPGTPPATSSGRAASTASASRAPIVKALLLYGEDNGIDGIVLEVLLRKHEAIRKDLGISVPVPPQSDAVLAALLEGVLMRGKDTDQLTLDLGLDTQAQILDEQWRSTAEAEKASRTRYAQARIKPDDVQAAVDAARHSLGEPATASRTSSHTVLAETAALLTPTPDGFTADLSPTPVGLRDALGRPTHPIRFSTDLPAPRGAAVLVRTDPRIGALARYTLDAALDPALPTPCPASPALRRHRHQGRDHPDRGPARAVPHPPAPARPRPDHHPPGRGGPRPGVHGHPGQPHLARPHAGRDPAHGHAHGQHRPGRRPQPDDRRPRARCRPSPATWRPPHDRSPRSCARRTSPCAAQPAATAPALSACADSRSPHNFPSTFSASTSTGPTAVSHERAAGRPAGRRDHPPGPAGTHPGRGGRPASLAPATYHLAGNETVRDAAARAWSYLRGAYISWQEADAARTPGSAGTGLARDRWLLPLLRELGYGNVPAQPSGFDLDDTHYPISHTREHIPVHLLGPDADLDKRNPGIAGAARAPQAMVQEFLNRSDEHLWGRAVQRAAAAACCATPPPWPDRPTSSSTCRPSSRASCTASSCSCTSSRTPPGWRSAQAPTGPRPTAGLRTGAAKPSRPAPAPSTGCAMASRPPSPPWAPDSCATRPTAGWSPRCAAAS